MRTTKSSNEFNKWDKRYLEIAKSIATWSTCYRHDVGCVIVVNNRIVATGYNGAPSGIVSCKERGTGCYKLSKGISSGYTFCKATHAEENAIIQAAKMGISVNGGTLYCTHMPCSMCAKSIMNSGIKRVIYIEDFDDEWSKILQDNNRNVEFIQYIEDNNDSSNNKD